VIAARRFFPTRFHGGALQDLDEIRQSFPECIHEVDAGLDRIKARRDEADTKTGRLEGCLSHSFRSDSDDTNYTGRIIYKMEGLLIRILAVHPDHDEAYRRARARLKHLG
jgi:hypothetical protein